MALAIELQTKGIDYQELEVGKIVFPVLRGGDYQRDLNNAKVDDIVSGYNPLRLGTPEVAFYNGHYWAWDGQHRLVALKRLGIHTVWCRIAYGYSIQELADAFADQGKNRTAVGAKDTLRAKLAANSSLHEAALSTLDAYGYRLPLQRGHESPAPNAWRCHGAIREVLGRDEDVTTLALICRALRESWGDCTPCGTTIGGLAQFIRAYRLAAPSPAGEKDYFARTLVSALKDHDEDGLLRRARSLDRTGTTANKLRWVLVSCYNSGRRSQFRLPRESSLTA